MDGASPSGYRRSDSLDPAFRQQHPQIPWREIAGMRNILVHDYSRVNLDIVWETVATQVPKLKSEVETILSRLPPET